MVHCGLMKITQINHTALPVDDLERSCHFYTDLLGLKLIPRPAFTFPGAWFGIGNNQQLHLIARGVFFNPGPRERHFALLVNDLDAFACHLREKGIEFIGPKRRPDGAMQIFLPDPDGHTIELCMMPI